MKACGGGSGSTTRSCTKFSAVIIAEIVFFLKRTAVDLDLLGSLYVDLTTDEYNIWAYFRYGTILERRHLIWY